MKRKLFLILAIIGSVSCREQVQDDFPAFEPVPVVYSILRAGEPVQVHLSWTASLDTGRLKMIDRAEVKLYANGQYLETLEYSGSGLYTATLAAVSSVRYRCEITVPGMAAPIVAADSLPSVVALSNVTYIPVAGRDEEGLAYPAVKFTFANTPGERRYFEAVIYEVMEDMHYSYDNSGNTVWTSGTVPVRVQPGPVTDPVLKSEGLPVSVFSNELIKGSSYTMTVNFTNGSAGRSGDGDWIAGSHPTILELRAVSHDYYRYAKSKYLYKQGFEPEFGKPVPAASLFSNIHNGYGIFSGYAVSVSDTLNNINR